MKVGYDAEMREKAKSEGLHLVTLDIYGKFAKRSGATCQGRADVEMMRGRGRKRAA